MLPTEQRRYYKVRNDLVSIKTKSSTMMRQIARQNIYKKIQSVNSMEMIAEIDSLSTNITLLKQNADILSIVQVLEFTDGTLQIPSNATFVKCKKLNTISEAIDKAGLKEFVRSWNIINKHQDIYIVRFNAKELDMMNVSRLLFETGLCEFAEPCFSRMLKLHNPNYPNQWGLKNTGQYGGTSGIDIKAEQAWAIARGNSIRVAVIDEGVDLDHNDLNILQGFDATTHPAGNSNGGPSGNDAHGTACAGIIGALDNTRGGIGVAPLCSIIPVRIAYSVDGNFGRWNWQNDSCAVNGIRYAWETAQADVLRYRS